MAQEHALVALARRAVRAYVLRGESIAPPAEPTEEMTWRAGVFVSLHLDGQLRGCIGTIEPVQASVASEVIANAISAATRDPRFDPVTPDELDGLDISVDVLTPAAPVASFDELDPRIYGVIVSSGRRRGLLLPDLEGVDTVQRQVEIALRKAWIDPQDDYTVSRFEVIRYH